MVDSSPWLFAATHVLHRHLAPRHPPLALHSLKSHGPRTFERAENSLEHRGPQVFTRRSCSLCSSQSSSRDEARLAGGGMHRSGAELNGTGTRSADRKSDSAASSKQSSENRAHDVSVVPGRPGCVWSSEERRQLAGAPGSRWCRETRRPVLDVGTSRQPDNIRVRTGQWVP